MCCVGEVLLGLIDCVSLCATSVKKQLKRFALAVGSVVSLPSWNIGEVEDFFFLPLRIIKNKVSQVFCKLSLYSASLEL